MNRLIMKWQDQIKKGRVALEDFHPNSLIHKIMELRIAQYELGVAILLELQRLLELIDDKFFT